MQTLIELPSCEPQALSACIDVRRLRPRSFARTSFGADRARGLAFAFLLSVPAIMSAEEAGHAAALVGQPSHVETTPPALASDTALKARYRRPITIPFPADDPYTPDKAALGKTLFFDPILSRHYAQSCASCHSPALGWSDGLATGVGDGMNTLSRRSPRVLDLAWSQAFMWDGSAETLEQQALGPIQGGREMNLPLYQLVARLKGIVSYGTLFSAAFPGEAIDSSTVSRALATFERTIVSNRSPFDDWIDGDESALAPGAKRGFALFNTKARCAGCHEGWSFTDYAFHDIGLASNDPGRGKFMPGVVKMLHAFKTPSLRDIARRGPYMHDGSIATLDAVVDHYDHGGAARPSRSELIRPLGLTLREKTDLLAFLQTLNSHEEDRVPMPALPR